MAPEARERLGVSKQADTANFELLKKLQTAGFTRAYRNGHLSCTVPLVEDLPGLSEAMIRLVQEANTVRKDYEKKTGRKWGYSCVYDGRNFRIGIRGNCIGIMEMSGISMVRRDQSFDELPEIQRTQSVLRKLIPRALLQA